jgi:hypothetical protein
MDENPNFSQRNNAKRAAEKMIAAGTAPAVDYGIRTRDDGRFEIAWKDRAAEARERLGMPPTTEQVEMEIATAVAEAEQPETQPGESVDAAPENSGSVAQEQAQPDPVAGPEHTWPVVGSRVKVSGTIVERVDPNHWRIQLDDGAATTIVVAGSQLSAPRRLSVAKPRTERRMSKAAELDARAARGEMPDKPDVTSHANHHYQKRFDALTAFAVDGDWDAIRAYECNGVNSYAKMVRQYRDRLLAAHDAQQAQAAHA